MEAPRIPKPKWTRKNNLFELAVEWQEGLYMSKFTGIKHMDNIFVVAFDTKPNNAYVFPSEASLMNKEFTNVKDIAMLQDLFRPRADGDFKRGDLNILPKILQMIAQTNVLPRMGDRNQIRQYEVTWENAHRKMIPHCRLITALMRTQNALDKNTYYMPKPHKLLELEKLSKTMWTYKKTRRRVLLRDRRTRQVLMGMVPNAPLLAPGEEEELLDSTDDEDNEGQEGVDGDNDEEEEEEGESTWGGHEFRPAAATHEFESQTMEAMIRSMSPLEYDGWMSITKIQWDQNSKENILAAERHEEMMKKQQ
ncbi:hypothetical protein L1987_13664 [Smallanthus sonchifolius]|uniref:Uncharacterized protein n=1 Tax=Smallanthus sonchifolius TaxID=185202 RepID=A0ACB9JI62_9ASTR|nr:hypothetical protein L1987_13664 [Smallanthus sonchifolius]